jgi:hypothetical protein
MHIQVINFGINVSHEDFLSGATELAPNFASLPGLVSKHWLGDEENKNLWGCIHLGKQRTLRGL